MIYVHILIGDLAPCNIIPFFQPYQDWTKTLAKECQLWRYFEFLAGRFILLEVECDLKYMYINVIYSFKDCPICKPRPQSRTLFSVTMVMSDCFIWHNNQPNSKIPVPDRFDGMAVSLIDCCSRPVVRLLVPKLKRPFNTGPIYI